VTSACDRHRQTLDCSICGAMFYVLKRTKRHPVDLYFSEIKRLHILRENITAVCEHFRSLVAVINYTNSSEIRLFGFISDAANFIVLAITAMHRMSANAVCAIIVVGITSEYSVLSTPKLAFKFVAGQCDTWPVCAEFANKNLIFCCFKTAIFIQAVKTNKNFIFCCFKTVIFVQVVKTNRSQFVCIILC